MTDTSYKSVMADIETANPPNSLTQSEIWSLVSRHVPLTPRAHKLYRTFLSDDGIRRRYFGWSDLPALLHESPDQTMQRFEYWAVRLAVEAAKKVLDKNGLNPQDIHALFVSTCTGYLCPGLSTYVSQQLGLPQDVYNSDLVGLGCVGALPALRAADHYLYRYPQRNVLVIAVEICSAAVHWSQQPELILSNAIFSDGAAAVLLTNRPVSGLRIKNIASLLWPQHRDQLRFKYAGSRLCNVISARVPSIVADAISVLERRRPSRQTQYAFHSGGRKILDTIQQRLGLPDEQMKPSRDILRGYGNMSSPSVLFSLKEIFRKPVAEQVVCFSFGAGFQACILEAVWHNSF